MAVVWNLNEWREKWERENHPYVVPDPDGKCFINNLPLEILSRILNRYKFPVKQRVHRRVCRYWNECVEIEWRSQTELDFGGCRYNDYGIEVGNSTNDLSVPCDHSFRKKGITRQRYTSQPHGIEEMTAALTFITKRFPNLKAIRVGDKWSPLVPQILDAYGHQLQCFYCPHFVLDEKSLSVLKPSATLRHLSLSSVDLSDVFTHFPKLEALQMKEQNISVLKKLPAGFQTVVVSGGPAFDYLKVISETPACDTIRHISVNKLSVTTSLSSITFPSLESIKIMEYPIGDLRNILRLLSRSVRLKSIELPQTNESSDTDHNQEWINLFRRLPDLKKLDACFIEISDEVFDVMTTSCPNISNLKMELKGERVAATTSAFQSIGRLTKLETIELFFDQEKEEVDADVMMNILTGPAQYNLEVIRIDHSGTWDERDEDKWEEALSQMMEMVSEGKLQIGEIFGMHID